MVSAKDKFNGNGEHSERERDTHTPADTLVVRESISVSFACFCALRACTTVGVFGVLSNLAVTNCVILFVAFDLRNGRTWLEYFDALLELRPN